MKRGVRTILILIAAINKSDSNNYLKLSGIYEDSFDSSRESLNSFVLNISISDCFLNEGSFDQIGQFKFNANAKYGVSLSDLCGDNSRALDSEPLKESLETIFTNFVKSDNVSLNCFEFNLEYFNMSDSFFFNSSIAYSGINSSNPNNPEFIIINLTGLSLKNERSILASTTNFIYHPSSLYLFHIPSLTLSPNLRQSSSVNSEFSNILSSFLRSKALLTFSHKNLRIDSDKFNSGKSSICFFNSSDIDKVMFGILDNSVYPVEDVQLFKPFDLIRVSELNKNNIERER